MTTIDLNADLGELPGRDGADLDARLIRLVSSANVATGGHAGDSVSMARVCRSAVASGVAVGAHVSYPDRANFGRVSRPMEAAELSRTLLSQLQTLLTIAERAGTTVRYVKPHGALYHDAAADPGVARVVLSVAASAGIGILTLPDRHLHRAAHDSRVNAFSEAFADRAYQPDGSLVPRNRPGAVLTDERIIRERVVALARRTPIGTQGAETLTLTVDSICLHGDTPGAIALARTITRTLVDSGLQIRPFSGGPA